MPGDNYQYVPQPLPVANIPGSDAFSAAQYSNSSFTGDTPQVSAPAPGGNTNTPGGGGGGTGTVDLDLCDGNTVRVFGYVLPP